MNSIYTKTIKQEIKGSLTSLAVFLCLLGGTLFLQSLKFASSLWFLLQFGYGEWQKYLLSMLDSLLIWAVITGIIFSIQFFIAAPPNHLKMMLSSLAIGFITGFIFTYFLVLVIGIIIYIPFGIISIFIPGIIKFATLEFAWFVAAYIIFLFIVIETPGILFDVIKNGNWYFKLLGILVAALLCVQTLKAIAGGLLIIMENSIWRTNPALITLGISLLVTIIINIILIKRAAIPRIIIAIIIVYVASIISGNVSYGIFHWGEIPSLILESFIGPIAYTLVAKIIITHGINAISGIFGFFGGNIIALLFDHFAKLRITGQGWSGILCGTMITIVIGIGFGLFWGPTITRFLTVNARINPITSFCMGAGLFLGIIVGMVAGGFITI